jgi:D-sedoheptulose 7-phosphate isomerase
MTDLDATPEKREFDLDDYWTSQTLEHMRTAESTFDMLGDIFGQCLDVCVSAIQAGNKILFCGNGGSASDAQHLATELSVRFIHDRKPIAALSLTMDTTTLTACANDMGFDSVFARQIESIGQEGDILITLSTSGNSPNVIKALAQAKQQGLISIGLGGKGGGEMAEQCDIPLIVPSDTTARIQEMHITIGHLLCGALEQRLGLTDHIS